MKDERGTTMNLVEIYSAYKEESTEYITWLEAVVNSDFQNDAMPIIRVRLIDTKEQLEKWMEACANLEVEEKDKENLKDLRYLILDSLFLAADLVRFFETDDLGRFKMRVLNYLNKKRRAEMFGETPGGSCRVMPEGE